MWTLLLSRQADPPGTFIDRRQIDSGEIRIGRDAARCDWVLADTSGHISRVHCTLSVIGLDLFVVDMSTNGVSLNSASQRIAPQMPVAVRVNDRLLVGDYAIEVTTQAAGLAANLQQQVAAASAPPPVPAFSQPDSWFDGSTDPWGTGAPSAEVHEFLGNAMHDFLTPPRAASAPMGGDPWGGPMSDAFSRPILASSPAAAASDFAIPEDWAAPPAAARAAPAVDPFAGMEAFAAPVDPFGGVDPFATPAAPVPVPVPASDPFAGQSAAAAPFAAPATHDPFAGMPDPFAGFDAKADPFAGFGDAPVEADPFATSPPPPRQGLPRDDPFALPTPAVSPPLTQPVAPAAATPPDADGWAAFCAGAGIDPADLRTTPDAMHRLGVLYKQVVLGLSDLIQDRAAFKNEFRVERTQLGLGRNNPLKHLPALDSAKFLLGDPLPGFMGSEESVRSAFEDVKKHQMAMLAGVQHALRAVFERLSPEEIQRVMQKATGETKGLRIGRGVNPWTVYQAVFDALRKDATSNVNSIMSVAFREGYEAFLNGAH